MGASRSMRPSSEAWSRDRVRGAEVQGTARSAVAEDAGLEGTACPFVVLALSVGQLASGFLVSVGYVVPFAFGSALAVVAWLVRSQVREAEEPFRFMTAPAPNVARA